MAPSRFCLSLAASLTCLAVLTSGADAQDWFVGGALDRSFSGSAPYRAPGGFTLGAGGVAIAGPFGLQAAYTKISAGGDEVVRDCVGSGPSCVPGTLATGYALRTLGLGLSYDFVNPTDVMLTLALTGTKSWHDEEVEHLATGSSSRHELASSLGLSLSAHLRLRPVVSVIRPELILHYDYNGRGECAAGTACWSGRSAFGVALGVGVVLRPAREG